MLPSAMQVSYHCACFCHHKLIEVGFVCSVCLSSKFRSQHHLMIYTLHTLLQFFASSSQYAPPASECIANLHVSECVDCRVCVCLQ